MKQPAQIRFVGMEPSEAVEAAARRKLEKLDLFRPDILACRVTIALADKHRHQGRSFNVRVDVTVPEHEIAGDRTHDEDVHVALRDAFDDVKRQLQDTVRRVRGQEQQQARPLQAHVPDEGQGTA